MTPETDLPQTARIIAAAQDLPPWRLRLARLLLSAADRATLYYDLATYTDRGIKFPLALAQLYLVAADCDQLRGHEPKSPYNPTAVCLADLLWRYTNRGEPLLTVALDWFPNIEATTLGHMPTTGLTGDRLRDLARTVHSLERTLRHAKLALLPVILLFLGVVLFFYGISVWFFPQFLNAIPKANLTGHLQTLKAISDFFVYYGYVVLSLLASVFAGVFWALPNLTGSARVLFDHLPLVSLYREMTGIMFVKTLAVLMTTSQKIPACLKIMREGASPYLDEIIADILSYDHLQLGDALLTSDRRWPSPKLIRSIRVAMTGANPPRDMARLADLELDRFYFRIDQLIETTSTVAMYLITLFVAWVIMATNDLTTAMQLK